MADGHHKSYLFFLGCGEEKEPTVARNIYIEPTARTEKYITSIMDEESSDHLNEAGIPMLISGYSIVRTMKPKYGDLNIYMSSNTK